MYAMIKWKVYIKCGTEEFLEEITLSFRASSRPRAVSYANQFIDRLGMDADITAIYREST
jgi:hypothetical protein